MTPLVLLVGQAGSGKDTVADFMVKNHGATKLALADPMKRLARAIFGFDENQLWGPSEARNAVDPRYGAGPTKATIHATDVPGEFVQILNGKRVGSVLTAEEATDPYNVGNKTWQDALVVACSSTATTDTVEDILIRGLGIKKKTREKALDMLSLGIYAAKTGVIRKWVMDCGRAHLEALTPRYVLQTLGTEVGRALDKDLWVRYGIGTAQQLLGGGYGYDRAKGLTALANASQGPSMVVVTDGRFRNEILAVQHLGGAVIRIDSPRTQAVTGGVTGHASEAEQKLVPDKWFSAILKNDKSKGLDNLATAVDDVVHQLFDHRQVIR